LLKYQKARLIIDLSWKNRRSWIGYQPKGEKSQMRTSRKLTHYLMAVFAAAMMSMAAFAQIGNQPGNQYPSDSPPSDQKAGSLLVYNIYDSNSSNVAAKDTKINITNTNDSNPIIVHFFFVNSGCSVADFKTELTANQTLSFLASDNDPDTRGYIVAVAENYLGIPIHFNYLIGDLYYKNLSAADSHQANLGAVAFAANWTISGSISTIDRVTGNRAAGAAYPGSSQNAVTLDIAFDGTNYNRQPGTVALSNIPSRAGNDRTVLILNSVRGSFLTGLNSNTIVGSLFGLLFDDAENSQSFQISIGCQYLQTLDNSNPRTVPRFDSVIPAGRTGWMKLYSQSGLGLLGSMIVYDQQARVDFEGGHNLHALTLSSNSNTITLPIFPFSGN